MTNAGLEKEHRKLEQHLETQRRSERQSRLQNQWLARCAPPKVKYPFPSTAVALWLANQKEKHEKI